MKILHTNFLHGWGGQSNRILMVCEGLMEKGHQVYISAPDDSVLVEKAYDIGIPLFRGVSYKGGLRPHKVIPDIYKLRKFMKAKQFDIIHLHGSQDSWVGAIAAMGSPESIVVRTKHNIFPIRDNIMNRFLYGKRIDAYVGISEAIMEQLRSIPYIKDKPMELIHSAVEYGRFCEIDSERADEFKKEFNISEDALIIGAVGRLRPEKGFEHLIKAIPMVVRKFPFVKFMFVGDGSLRDSLQEIAKGEGISDYIIFTGFRNDVPTALSAIDIFVMPSLSEGLGTAVLEAMACGKPIIASNIGGIPDSIKDGKTGLLIPPADPGMLGEAIIRLINNKEMAKQLSLNAAKFVEENFSPEVLVNKNIAFYERLKELRS